MSQKTEVTTVSGEPSLPAGHAEMQSVLERIDACSRLSRDWDGEGGVATTRRAAALAGEVVRRAANRARESRLEWHPPGVVPTGEGGVDLTWHVGNRRAFLVIRAAPEGSVVAVTREAEGRAVRQVVSPARASEIAVWAIGKS